MIEQPQSLNLLLVLPGYPTINGMPSYFTWLVNELKAQYHVKILVPTENKKEQLSHKCIEGVDIYSAWIPNPLSCSTPVKSILGWIKDFPKTFIQLKNFLASNDIHVIHSTFHSYNYVFRLLMWMGGPRYLVTLHGSETVYFEKIPWQHRHLVAFVLGGAEQIITVSNALGIQVGKKFPKLNNVETIYNGIGIAPIEASHTVDVPIEVPESYCLIVGRLHPVKGIDIAIQAWQQVQQSIPDNHLIIVGDGSERSNYEAQINRLGLNDKVHLTGALDNASVRNLMMRAQLLVLPSRSEAFGLVCLEAGLAAIPVVATRVGGVPEIVDDNSSGFLVDPENAQALALKVVKLLGDDVLRKSFGLKHYEKVAKQFDSQTLAEQYCDIYRRLIDPS